MSEALHLLRPEDAEWDVWIRRAPHDFYHLSAYHAFSEAAGEGRAAMAVYGTETQFLAWPYLIRDVDGTHADATSVYGYSGPTGLDVADPAFRRRAWAALRDVWREQKLVSLFTRFHPLLENDRHCADLQAEETPPGGEILHLGRSVSIDLVPDHDARRMTYKQTLRQDIKKAERNGLVVEPDPEWRHLAAFVAFYRATMEHNAAADRYLFSRQYFEDFAAALPDVAHLAVARLGEDIVGGMLFTVHGDIAQAHLIGSNPDHAKLMPQKNLIDGVSELARQHGARVFHIGAGRGGHEDVLFAFKSRFSPRRHDFKLGRWTLDSDANAALCGRMGTSGDPGFFPAYRAPVDPLPV